jgi:hypothetical protein
MTVTNTEASVIETAEVSATVAVPGADSSYTIDFEPRNPLPEEAVIQIHMPETLTLSTTQGVDLECLGTENLLGVLECTYDP